MKKRFLTILLILVTVSAAFAQTKVNTSRVIGFYNLENLFDN